MAAAVVTPLPVRPSTQGRPVGFDSALCFADQTNPRLGLRPPNIKRALGILLGKESTLQQFSMVKQKLEDTVNNKTRLFYQLT